MSVAVVMRYSGGGLAIASKLAFVYCTVVFACCDLMITLFGLVENGGG